MLRRFLSTEPRIRIASLWQHHPSLINAQNDPSFPVRDLYLFPNFVAPSVQSSLIASCQRLLRKQPFESAHFDHVITAYRETQTRRLKGLDTCLEVLDKVNEERGEQPRRWKSFHVLELEKKRGSIGGHVDHVDYSGKYVAGLCLMSSAVMRFQRVDDETKYADVLLHPGTFYIQTYMALNFTQSDNIVSGKVRYDYKHSVEPTPDGFFLFRNDRYPHDGRISIMMRDEPDYERQNVNQCNEQH